MRLASADNALGAGPFSEPETSAIKQVAAEHKPLAILHWHGWGNDLAFPYSYDWRAPLGTDELSLYQVVVIILMRCERESDGMAS